MTPSLSGPEVRLSVEFQLTALIFFFQTLEIGGYDPSASLDVFIFILHLLSFKNIAIVIKYLSEPVEDVYFELHRIKILFFFI